MNGIIGKLKWLGTGFVLTGILLTNLNIYPLNIFVHGVGVIFWTFSGYLLKYLSDHLIDVLK